MLKNLTLGSLGETKLKKMFEESLNTVETSLEKDSDIRGKRSITIELSFEPNDRGYINVDMSVKARTPHRSILTIASLEDSNLKIDTVSNDAQQPDLLESSEKIVQMKQEV